MKFLDKWVELETIILSEVTQSQKKPHGMYSLNSEYIPRVLFCDWVTSLRMTASSSIHFPTNFMNSLFLIAE